MGLNLGLLYRLDLLAAALLAYSFPSSLSQERPLHTLYAGFIICAVALLASSKYTRPTSSPTRTKWGSYESLPLEDLSIDTSVSDKNVGPVVKKSRLGTSAVIVIGAALVLTLRFEIYRQTSNASECAGRTAEVFIPVIVAIYETLRTQKWVNIEAEDHPDNSIYDGVHDAFRVHLLRPAWRYVPSAVVLSAGCYLITGLWSADRSTYICSISSGSNILIPRMQIVSLFLDASLAIAAYELSIISQQSPHAHLSPCHLWAAVLMLASGVWTVVAFVSFSTQPENRKWLLLQDLPSPKQYMISAIWQILLFCSVCIPTLLNMSKLGVLHMAMVLTGLLTSVSGVQFLWHNRKPFPPASSTTLTWSFVAASIGWSSYCRVEDALGVSDNKPSGFRQFLTFVIVTILLFPGLLKTDTVHFHPIDLFMYDAQKQHERYVNDAANSRTIQQAVTTYAHRYNSNPPPGFDIWFEFARNRSVWITDEFDQIHQDLLPFRVIKPEDIRRQTWEMVSNPWNEISGITIRSGRAEVQENVLPTHRWMLEGVAVLINSFSQHLPDMDLAFNLNDESRVAMPYEEITKLRSQGQFVTFNNSSSWSSNRSEGWLPIPNEPYAETILENWSFHNTFRRYGAVGCPPNSPAHTISSSNSKAHLCTSCVTPHSMGQFVSNWTLAADVCHQPDLANLHGFYTSPAAFKTSHLLRPVFSQSKPHGYNDILYPSAWNYMDKIAYAPVNSSGVEGEDDHQPGFPDPPFSEKDNLMYWRGATSEGVSPGTGTWRGMTRQRFVHMANHLTSSAHEFTTLLIPNFHHPKKYIYTSFPGSILQSLGLKTDIRFVDHIVRCGGIDCTAQESEFTLVQPVPFQMHWKYRYLFDLDGAGFSGRFLPFLQSRSLPFKTALFREWYDSRLTPWLHFVPQDLRLHGVWSTLAYFAGLDGTDHKGRRVKWEGHVREAEFIAEAGRDWAAKALRKEDMEVYFFRLLLEWARLVDDNRENLGFALPNR